MQLSSFLPGPIDPSAPAFVPPVAVPPGATPAAFAAIFGDLVAAQAAASAAPAPEVVGAGDGAALATSRTFFPGAPEPVGESIGGPVPSTTMPAARRPHPFLPASSGGVAMAPELAVTAPGETPGGGAGEAVADEKADAETPPASGAPGRQSKTEPRPPSGQRRAWSAEPTAVAPVVPAGDAALAIAIAVPPADSVRADGVEPSDRPAAECVSAGSELSTDTATAVEAGVSMPVPMPMSPVSSAPPDGTPREGRSVRAGQSERAGAAPASAVSTAGQRTAFRAGAAGAAEAAPVDRTTGTAANPVDGRVPLEAVAPAMAAARPSVAPVASAPADRAAPPTREIAAPTRPAVGDMAAGSPVDFAVKCLPTEASEGGPLPVVVAGTTKPPVAADRPSELSVTPPTPRDAAVGPAKPITAETFASRFTEFFPASPSPRELPAPAILSPVGGAIVDDPLAVATLEAAVTTPAEASWTELLREMGVLPESVEVEVAPAARTANFAEARTNLPVADGRQISGPEKKVLGNEAEVVTRPLSKVGTAVAESPVAMPAANFARRPAPHIATHDGLMSVAAPGSLSAPNLSAPIAPTEAPVRAAQQAVDAVLSLTERFSTTEQHAVNLKFTIGGSDLQVRVSLRADEVHTSFRTESPELRAALAQEWQSVTAPVAGERAVKFADPVFSSTSHFDQGSPGSAQDHAAQQQHQRESSARREAAEFSGGFTRTSSSPFARAVATPAPAPLPAFATSSGPRLHTFA